MKLRSVSRCALIGALVVLCPITARAADADPKKAEAAQRFDRGLQLFDDGDNSGALAEFKKTYELFPNPVVLYNIGLVYAAMGRPVDAVAALEPAVSGGGLSASQLERGKRTLEDQKARIGRLTVTTKPEGARIEIDNVQVATTPLTAPLKVAEGNHIVGAVAEGFAPSRKEVVIAGNSDASVALELVPSEGKRLANLTIRSETRGADVVVDGQVSGKTPLSTSIPLVAGHHKVELKRAGYAPQSREVDVGEGATGELAFSLAVDAAALPTDGATFALESSEKGVDVTIDGERKGIYTEPLRIPKGPHHLSLATAGFYPVERDVDLDPSKTNIVHVAFEPTPETRAAYESSANFHRTWGWIGIISGAVIGGAGGVYLATAAKSSADKLSAAQTANDQANAINNAHTGVCDYSTVDPAQCQALLNDAAATLDSADKKHTNDQIIGFTGIGIGVAVLATGVILLVTGDDPHKYDHPASNSLGKRPAPPRFALTPGPGQFGTGFALAF